MKRKPIDESSRGPLFSKGDLLFTLTLFVALSIGAMAIPKDQSAMAKTPVVATMPAAGGSITGTVRFTGPTPRLARANAAAFGFCGKTHSYDRLFIGKNRGVEYTLIYVTNPPAGGGNVPAPTITQEDCGYTPHMTIAPRGSSVTFVNDDPGLHNVHGRYISGSESTTLFNFAQPTKGEQTQQKLRKAGMVSIECDVHPWMNGWIWVTDNPYVAVTKADGSYSINGLPPGTYHLIMWHEGWKMKSSSGRPTFTGAVVEHQTVTVPAGGSATANFALK